jgi:uncharacterized protein (TIGR04255 family)
MSKCYKKPYLDKVIVRIDFTANFNLPQKGLNKKISDEILKLFPIPEPREVLSKQVLISKQGTKEIQNKQNHLFYHGKSREKTFCLTPEFMYIEINKYETYVKLKDEFLLIVDRLAEQEDFSAKRFGLRYINQIKTDNELPFDWTKYLNPNLLNMFNIPEDKSFLSRAFSNVIQQFDDGMLLNFQYGMHNPDFPSRIKQKLFILDYDSYYQGVLNRDEVIKYIDSAHERIEQLYENSITQDLRDIMIEENDD